MRGLKQLAFAATAFSSYAAASPIQVTPGDAGNLIVNSQDTLNATSAPATWTNTTAPSSNSPFRLVTTMETVVTSGQLSISMVNSLASSNVHAYVTGLDVNGALVMLQPDGSWFYPTGTASSVPVAVTANVAIPLGAEGSTTTITLPGYISAGRIWFADGTLQFYTVLAATGATSLVEPSPTNPSDPSADVNWGYIELTNTAAGGLYVNLSFVDFAGLPFGITLNDTSGNVYEALGLVNDAVPQICGELALQTEYDGQSWHDLCMYSTSGSPLRVLSPYNYLAGINNSAFADYFTTYIDQVWSYYTSTPLTIDTQTTAGLVQCTVSASTNLLTCAGDNRGYAQPTASDIFGCNGGPFAIQSGDNAIHLAVVPRLCAAFHRSTFLLPGGDTQPELAAEYYYNVDPTNWYSAIVHYYQIDGKGYAFPYDDVTPTGDVNESGLLASTSPASLTIFVGGAC